MEIFYCHKTTSATLEKGKETNQMCAGHLAPHLSYIFSVSHIFLG
jgi:hypothetical protein